MAGSDELCRQHDKTLTELSMHVSTINKDLDSAVDRWQLLIDQHHELRVSLAEMKRDVNGLTMDMEEIKTLLRDAFASREEFLALRNQVWAGVGVVVVGFLSMLFKLLAPAAAVAQAVK